MNVTQKRRARHDALGTGVRMVHLDHTRLIQAQAKAKSKSKAKAKAKAKGVKV